MTFLPKVHMDGPDELVIESGGSITAAGTQASAVADFTGTTGGTANGAMEDTSTVVTGVDGTGSNAASKADVDARLASIANNIEELGSDLDLIKAVLRGAGLMAS